MALDPFEEPKKKSGTSLAQALATLGGGGGGGTPGGTALLWGSPVASAGDASGGPASPGAAFVDALGGGGLGGGISQGYAGPTGPLGGTLASAISLGNLGMKSLGTLGGYLGIGALSPFGLAATPLGAMSIAGKIASLMGVQPGWGHISPDFQGIRDIQGAFAEEDARTESAIANSLLGDLNTPQTDPSVGAAEPGMDPGGIGHDAGDTGQAGYARGGARTFTQPSRPLVGEAGPETGIFIPAFMRRPGLQGNETQVRDALMRAILNLR